MIISASRRTDIPTYYSEWFARRVEEGFLYVRNPMNALQLSRIDLSPEVVDCIVFWTKNPIPMLPRLDAFDRYPYYFQFTLTGYDTDVESGLPDKWDELIPAFIELSKKIGPDRVIWRYDPIVINDRYDEAYHLNTFRRMAESLGGYTEKCVISFVDIYRKNTKSMRELNNRVPSDEMLLSFAGELSRIAKDNGMVIATCAEKIDLSSVGIEHNSCIDKDMIERMAGGRLRIKKDPNQREACGCVSSIDIGAYNSCANGCKYCYANYSPENVRENIRRYDPMSEILCDTIHPDDNKTVREMKSLLEKQMELTF